MALMIFMIMAQHMSWWPPSIFFICVSVKSMPLLDLQDTLTLFLYFLWALPHGYLISVQAGETIPWSCVQVSNPMKLPQDELESEDTQSLSVLGAACYHCIIVRIGWPSWWDWRKGWRDSHCGCLRVSPGVWCWVRCIVIAPMWSYVHCPNSTSGEVMHECS